MRRMWATALILVFGGICCWFFWRHVSSPQSKENLTLFLKTRHVVRGPCKIIDRQVEITPDNIGPRTIQIGVHTLGLPADASLLDFGELDVHNSVVEYLVGNSWNKILWTDQNGTRAGVNALGQLTIQPTDGYCDLPPETAFIRLKTTELDPLLHCRIITPRCQSLWMPSLGAIRANLPESLVDDIHVLFPEWPTHDISMVRDRLLSQNDISLLEESLNADFRTANIPTDKTAQIRLTLLALSLPSKCDLVSRIQIQNETVYVLPKGLNDYMALNFSHSGKEQGMLLLKTTNNDSLTGALDAVFRIWSNTSVSDTQARGSSYKLAETRGKSNCQGS